MKKIVVSQPLPAAAPGGMGEAVDAVVDIAGGSVKPIVDKVRKIDFNKDTPGSNALTNYTEFNELANTFKNVFHVTDPKFTDAEKLREYFLDAGLFNDLKGLVPFATNLKDTLFAISGYSRFEPNIAQLLANFALNLLDRTRSFDQVNRKLQDIKDKASDTERPKDAYIIALLKGDYQTASLLLLLSDIGKMVSTTTLKDIQETQQLANKLLGPKSQELLDAQYLDNQQAAANAAVLKNSLAKFRAMIPMGVQQAQWRKQINQFGESFFKSDAGKGILASPIVTQLGAAAAGFESLKDVYKFPLKETFGGK
jgi:hypothetical protein